MHNKKKVLLVKVPDSPKLLRMLNHLEINTQMQLRSLIMNCQSNGTGEMLMDLISPDQLETKKHVALAMQWHLLKPLSQNLR